MGATASYGPGSVSVVASWVMAVSIARGQFKEWTMSSVRPSNIRDARG